MGEKISIVVAIYNIEKYIRRCIDSLINQTYKNIEIILVDDGSTDECGKICDNYKSDDERVIVIHKENQGLGEARNTGIENAHGKYICFIDGDDYVDINYISDTYKIAEEENAEIVLCGYKFLNKKNVLKSFIPESEKLVFKNEEIQEILLPDLVDNTYPQYTKNIIMTAWSALFSLETIKRCGWKFVSERKIISEDVYSLLKLYANINTVAICKNAYYYYCENSTSLTHIYREDRYIKVKQFYKETFKLVESLNYNENVKVKLVYTYISFSIAALKMIASADINNKYKKCKNILLDEDLIEAVNTTYDNEDKISKKFLFFWIKHKVCGLAYLIIKIKTFI